MTDWVSLTGADLLVSLRVPRGWEASAPDAHSLAVHAPSGATLSIRLGAPEAPGHDWFVAFASAVPGRLQDDLPGFELIGTERFRLSSFWADVLVVAARHEDGTSPATAQLQAYVWVSSSQMYVVAASTALAEEARDLPVLREIIGSLRILPPRPGG